MKRSHKYLLSVSSGVLLWLGWPPLLFFPFLLLGFIPILWLEEICLKSPKPAKSFFGYSYLALLTWNLLTTWWVGATYFGTNDISTAIAGIIANTANPLLMCIPLLAFHHTKKRLGASWGYISLIAYWITFEFIHLRWDLSWPWLTVGNGFAKFPQVIQWYEYTGVLGGTLWVLAANIILYCLLKTFIYQKDDQLKKKLMMAASAVIIIPVIISLIIYYTYQEKGEAKEVVVIQPNIDPYLTKFDSNTLDEQLATLLSLSKGAIDSTTDYLVWPETAIPQGILINELSVDPEIHKIRNFFSQYPQLEIITGVSAYAQYRTKKTPTARISQDSSFYWDAFNTAIQLDSSEDIPYYHKSKLVPGVEKMPYPELFKFLEPLAVNMGGITGSLGSQKERTVFFSDDTTGAAPLICYESIYGEYSNEYVQRGAGLLFVITNDGWWGNTAGYKQHLEYARLRSVETRRDLAQSANTGISAFINQRGDVSDATPWWQPAAIKSTMYANDEETFYVKFGDYIGRVALILTTLLFIWTTILRFRKRKKLI